MAEIDGATPERTAKFMKGKKSIKPHPDKLHLFQNLSVSALGLGTYLGSYDQATDALYEEAILTAIENGCNFIDTAINYRCQRSERTIGVALRKMFEKKLAHREEIIVATKGGFIPFDSEPAANMEAYLRKNWIEPGIVREDDIVSHCHCLHPSFLEGQIEQSLKNLGLQTIDIYYIHNPETQISIIGPELFYSRLEEAFNLLEKKVKEGKIQFYGLATWTAFREPLGGAGWISLEEVWKIAKKAGGDLHHFRALQLPYNMAMLEAISVLGQTFEDQSNSVLTVAHHLGISVMVSAPLLQSQLLHIPPSLSKKLPGSLSLAQAALQFVISTPGVTSAMVGMKQKKHVEENLKILETADWDTETLQGVCDLLVKK